MQEAQKDIESDFWKEILRHLQHRIDEIQAKISIELIKAVLMKKFRKDISSVAVKIEENCYRAEVLSEGERRSFSFSKENLPEELSVLN